MNNIKNFRKLFKNKNINQRKKLAENICQNSNKKYDNDFKTELIDYFVQEEIYSKYKT